jgi:hypothetical protein
MQVPPPGWADVIGTACNAGGRGAGGVDEVDILAMLDRIATGSPVGYF